MVSRRRGVLTSASAFSFKPRAGGLSSEFGEAAGSERSRDIAELVETSAKAAKAEAKRKCKSQAKQNGKVSARTPCKNSTGRPPGKTAGSERETEERTGVKASTARDAKKHVDIAERFPFMKGPAWSQTTLAATRAACFLSGMRVSSRTERSDHSPHPVGAVAIAARYSADLIRYLT